MDDATFPVVALQSVPRLVLAFFAIVGALSGPSMELAHGLAHQLAPTAVQLASHARRAQPTSQNDRADASAAAAHYSGEDDSDHESLHGRSISARVRTASPLVPVAVIIALASVELPAPVAMPAPAHDTPPPSAQHAPPDQPRAPPLG